MRGRFKLVVLSNVDDDLFVGSAGRLGNPFHKVLTAQQVQSYKPAVANFEYAIRSLGGRSAEIEHVAQSLYHDIAPANRVRLSTVWINRRKGRLGSGATPMVEADPDLEFGSLSEFVGYLTSVPAYAPTRGPLTRLPIPDYCSLLNGALVHAHRFLIPDHCSLIPGH